MERRLATILLTDIVGYRRLIGVDDNGTISHQKAHRVGGFDPKISEHGGHVLRSTGDELLIEAPRVVDAVTCPSEVQRELAERDARVLEERRIQYRIGSNLGDIIVDGDDIPGSGVNVAARLEGLAEPGDICISGSVYDQLVGKLDIDFRDAGDLNAIPLRCLFCV